MDDERSTHQMVENLHTRFSGLEQRLDRLHGDHRELKEEVDVLAGELTKVKSWVERHEEVALLKLESLWAGLNRLETSMAAHTAKEERDRLWMFGMVFGTLLSALGGLVMMVARSVGVW